MRKYELMTIIKPNLDAEEVEKVIDKISATVTELGGSIDNVDKTGREKLAYDIQNFSDGFFTTMTLELPADKVAEFKRQLRLNDSLLRTMFMEVAQKASV